MDRRKFLGDITKSSLGILGASALPSISNESNSQNKKSLRSGEQPNILYVFADQLGTNKCGYSPQYAQDPTPYTPNINRLAREGTNFQNAVSGYPMCAPYRASLMTGKYPSSTGMVINELVAMPDPDAIGHVLNDNGYETGYLGKWHLYGNYSQGQYIPKGPYRLGFNDYWQGYNFHHKYYNSFYYNNSPDRIHVEDYLPSRMTDLAINFMKDKKDKKNPFALFLSLGPPHDPWTWKNCPESFAHLFKDKKFPDPPNFSEDGTAEYWVPSWKKDWYQNKWMPKRFRYRQVYASMVASLDWEFGRLLHALEEMDLADDTIVVFTSDHGEMFGSHGRVAKKIFYDEAARVPFLVRWPGHVNRQTSETCLNSPDIAPTLLGLAGIEIPDSYEGMDLSPIARGEHGDEPIAAFMQGMGHTYQWHNGDEWRAVRSKRYTYAKKLTDGSEYLFDNIEDPYQTKNLVNDPDHSKMKNVLKDYMYSKMDELNDPFKPTTWYRDHWIKDRVIVRSATRELEEKYLPQNLGFKYEN